MLLRSLIVAGVCTMLTAAPHAVDVNVTAQASFRAALTLNSPSPLDFTTGADIEYTGAPNTDVVRIATNGARTETGSFFIIPNATGQAGVVDITGTPGEIVDISCDDVSTLENGAGDEIELSSIEFHTGGGIAGAATACAGLGSSPGTLTLDGTDQVLIGGTIIASSGDGVTAGDYSTATATDPVVVRVVYQ